MARPVMSATSPSTAGSGGITIAVGAVVTVRGALAAGLAAAGALPRFHRYNVELLTPVSAAIAATFSPDRSLGRT
jgi:hypothetical protein